MKRFNFRLVIIAMLFVLLVIGVTSCSNSNKNKNHFSKLDDFIGKKIGVNAGSVYEDYVKANVGDCEIRSYDDMSGNVQALRKGAIDAFVTDLQVGQLIIHENTEFKLFNEVICTDSYGYMINKGTSLTEKFAAAINKFKEEGLLDKLEYKWIYGSEEEKVIDKSLYTVDSTAPVLKFGCLYQAAPLCYLKIAILLVVKLNLLMLYVKNLTIKLNLKLLHGYH